jgi:alginate O-acetyltransferase complex protein AlgI
MSLTSIEFLLLLGLCMVALQATKNVHVKVSLLIIFSYLFCFSFGLGSVIVITLVSLADFVVARRIGNSVTDGARRRWLWLGLAINLTPLAFFKYFVFIAGNTAALLQYIGANIRVPDIPALPLVGLSYFTFAGISYLLDVYNGKLEPSHSILNYMCYMVYFPKLIAGPIVRAADFLPQISRGFRVTAEDVEIGCSYLLLGSVKKLVIADHLAGHVSMIMAAPQQYNAATLLQGLVGFSVQLYADFSGYSDMVIGCARLMGFKLPQNFLMPYSSVNIAEFWRRWHITMSTWFRDYVFLPLEIRSRGMRNGNIRAARNIILTMLLCGLWHGPSWNFVLYGGVHGIALATYQLYVSVRRRQTSITSRREGSLFLPGKLFARALTLSVVLLSNILFATHTLSAAFVFLRRMLTWSSDGVALESPYILPLTTVVIIAHVLVGKDDNVIEKLNRYSLPIRVCAYASLLFALTSLVASEAVPFVYARF